MNEKYDSTRTIHLLETALSKIKNFGEKYIAYNTNFLGVSSSNDYIIRKKSTKNSKSMGEFCFGYEKKYNQMHILEVFQMPDGIKYASTELSNNIYGYWEIIE